MRSDVASVGSPDGLSHYTRIILTAFIAVTLLFAMSIAAGAQATSGTMTGVVTDPSGAVIPNATITIAWNPRFDESILGDIRDMLSLD